MDTIEKYLVSGRLSQFLNSKDVKEVEETMDKLEHEVMTVFGTSQKSVMGQNITKLKNRLSEVGQTVTELKENIFDTKRRVTGVEDDISVTKVRVKGVEDDMSVTKQDISVTKLRVTQIENNPHRSSNEHHHVRPRLSPFFVGRREELSKLKEVLEKYGRAVITQYGGVGKTDMMIALAESVERELPGGVFWLSVDGSLTSVIASLARLVEKFTGRKIEKQERKDPNAILAELKSALANRKGRWLLCLDNGDNDDLHGILNAVCAIARPLDGNGWVLITSRQGPKTWSEMKDEQMLVLGSLNEEDAMALIWRYNRGLKTEDVDDDTVLADINKLKEDNSVEYYALKELSGDDKAHCLGGLPLALVQAGTYIERYDDCSFKNYLQMFKEANQNEDMDRIMKKSNQLGPLREEQRSIITTWGISVKKLSSKAYKVFRAMAMMGPAPIGESIVRGILKTASGDSGTDNVMFNNVFVEELVHRSSLVYWDERPNERVYRMHRLVRRSVLGDMDRSSVVWKNVYIFALFSLHERIGVVLEKDGLDFNMDFNIDFDIFGEQHREFVPHVLAIIYHLDISSAGLEIGHLAKVKDIYWYSGHLLQFFLNFGEEARVWRSFLKVFHHQYGENEMNEITMNVLNKLGRALLKMGKLNESENTLQEGLEMSRAIHGQETAHSDIAASLNHMAITYNEQGRVNEALQMHLENLAMLQKIHGQDTAHSSIAVALCNVATIYHEQERLDEALEMHLASLEMLQKIHGQDTAHPSIAVALKNLALVYRGQGELDKALKMHLECLAMERSMYSQNPKHPSIARSLNNVALAYRGQRRLDDALKTHLESLAMLRCIHGKDTAHPSIAASLNNVALVHHEQGNLELAANVLKESLKMYKTIYGNDTAHPIIAILLRNLIYMYNRLGNPEEASMFRQQSMAMDRALYNERDVDDRRNVTNRIANSRNGNPRSKSAIATLLCIGILIVIRIVR